MSIHIENREEIVQSLREELVGPMPAGELKDFSGAVIFETREDAYGPFRQAEGEDEVLQRDVPTKRYGIGVLYPAGMETMSGDETRMDEAGVVGMTTLEEKEGSENGQPRDVEEISESTEKIKKALRGSKDDEGAHDLDLSLANAYRQSSLAISFLVETQEGQSLVIEGKGGRYSKKAVKISGKDNTWWLRSEVKLRAMIDAMQIRDKRMQRLNATAIKIENGGGLNLQIDIRSRSYGERDDLRLVTMCLVNRSDGAADENSLFQTEFNVYATGEDGEGLIWPYPKPGRDHGSDSVIDKEEASLELLYRNAQTFAVGHGCAADWDNNGTDRATSVRAEVMPSYDTRSITPDIWLGDGTEIKVPMAPLAGLLDGKDGFDKLEMVVAQYEAWIDARRTEIRGLDSRYQEAARRHMDLCVRCAKRMRAGISYLEENENARIAFRLANHAILMQQAYATEEPRRMKYDRKNMRFVFDRPYPEPDLLNPGSFKGNWRVFQIAFILMTLESATRGGVPERETVELIWFPTGGGKTEAYLGLAAFAMFMRRLERPEDAGVHVLMRYTLRLLTTQQFVRASRLICAMEVLRRQIVAKLGNHPFSIGMWVGMSTTPNTREQAKSALNDMKRWGGRNPFIVNQCPWCGAEMGALDKKALKIPKSVPHVMGYEQKGSRIQLQCPDKTCNFARGLPVYVVDEDVYENRPDFVVGTVDKFALLAWRPQARALFGIGANGERELSPPGLIIQDELHLISGPLGSMVGLYEGVIEELCTDRRGEKPVRPKIVSSTATTRRYSEQIKGLYARSDSVLFPPPGLEDGDSFFSQHARDERGELLPGRRYIGVHAPGLGSMQTVQVRTFTGLLQAVMKLPEGERDPWWSLLIFFNSLRELGTSLSLLQSDIPDYQRTLINRLDREKRSWRRFWNIMELTGRADSEAIARAISDLQIGYPNDETTPVDVCLASNIIEVGVDIDRLSLMTVVGQPKTTAQYIQVTGRIGRRWWERPGLVVTLFSASKPRDRSHFEKFRTYHEQLYAGVEPASVTPFSPPALDRGLHAVMAAYARQVGDQDVADSPYPFPEQIVDELKEILLPRLEEINKRELKNFKRVFEKRADEWRRWERSKWSAYVVTDDDDPLMVSAGSYISERMKTKTWQTPMSMRSVDAECLCVITGPLEEVEEEVTNG